MQMRASAPERQARPLALFLALGFVCVTALSAGRELYRQNQVKQEMRTLQERVAHLEERKATVSKLLQQLQTPEMIDREARLRLDMQRPGERVYVLRGNDWERLNETTAASGPTLYEEQPVTPIRSNPTRWFRFFFVHDTSSSA